MPSQVLIVPGWANSGPDHWQSHWQSRLGAQRVEQLDWDWPRRAAWVEGLRQAVDAATRPLVLVAHSLGCITVAHWALQARDARYVRARIHGALLVAPADVERPGVSAELADFAPAPRGRLPFPALVVASNDDPYCSLDAAIELARCWGAEAISLGKAGHINALSGHNFWTEGLHLLQGFDGLPAAESG